MPESLRATILDAVMTGKPAESADGRYAQELRRIGESLVVEAKSAPATHETAMTLLTADALITFACEAVAELEPERLSELR